MGKSSVMTGGVSVCLAPGGRRRKGTQLVGGRHAPTLLSNELLRKLSYFELVS
jgi:hypothetical protein